MSKFVIIGGRKLEGEIIVEGSKNAVLPILAASILNSGISIIKNCPKLRDVEVALEILKSIGCKVSWVNQVMTIDSSVISETKIPVDLAVEMRSSIIFLGPMLARCGKVTISYPGGCEIGPRPINLHLKALRSMGAKVFDAQRGFIYCEAEQLKGCDIHLDYPSVGATENIMLASVFANGDTYIYNAAKEPEIIDLQRFLRGIGVEVSGAGTSIIRIKGGTRTLRSVEHGIIPDRIVASTYAVAAAITGGDLLLKNVVPEHMSSATSILRECGCRIDIKDNNMRVFGCPRPQAIDVVTTLPYPGFPTDMQAQIVSLLSIARGTSIVVETVFENRYKHVEELLRMGANIKLAGRIAVIKGVNRLIGAEVCCRDLRGGAALVLAGLAADGETTITGLKHIERGYENIEGKLSQVGALISRIS
jgi:UDP-N-acetylglucosamine 1-carboxyvinyltransferase